MPSLVVAAVAVGAWIGATHPVTFPGVSPALVLGALVVGALGLGARGLGAAVVPALRGDGAPGRAIGLAVVVLLVASWRAGAVADRSPSVPQGPVRGVAELASDPVEQRGATEVEVRFGGARLLASARGAAGACLGRRLAGERVAVSATASARAPDDSWLARLGLDGTLGVEDCRPVGGGRWSWRIANAVRRTIERGARDMAEDRRALFVGLVYGDDREQPVGLADDFRRTGLGHLLAVSGQNVAFVLAVAAPALRRLDRRWRIGVAGLVLGLFAIMTRLEPSVLRAVAVAAGGVVADATGRRAEPLRLLGLAVAVLLVIDPRLAHELGFQLSVLASAGIVTLARPVEDLLPGPRAVAAALSVTIAAQVAVAPLLLATFGPVPVAALPANLLAGPAAGFVMMWGCTGGWVAGVLGGRAAEVLHLPTRACLWWLERVAGVGARLPLGALGGRDVAALAGIGLLAWTVRGRRSSAVAVLRGGLASAAAVVLLLPMVGAVRAGSAPAAVTVDGGADLWRGGGGVVVRVDGRTDPVDALADLRSRGVRRIDLLLVSSASRAAGGVVEDLRSRLDVGLVWGPAHHQVRGATSPDDTTRVRLGDVEVSVRAVSDDRLEVDVAVGVPP